MQNILVVEDDENIRNLIQIAMEGYGYQVRAFETAEEGLQYMQEDKPDLAIFDLMLPGMNGLEAIKNIRNGKHKDIPIIVLTAKDKEYDKVIGLDGGADDYMTKPFGVLELAARVRTLLRRSLESRVAGEHVVKAEKIQLDSFVINTAAREVRYKDKLLVLTFKEYELFMYLINNKERVVSREELLDELWGYNAEIETRTLDIHIRTLRQKLGDEGSSHIKTIRSVGYRFLSEEQI